MKVLIVEDNKPKLESILRILNSSGIDSLEHKAVSSSFEAKKELYETHFDLFILDLNIPQLSGDSALSYEGIRLMEEIYFNESFSMPEKIVALSHYEDAVGLFKEKFGDFDITSINFDPTSDLWEKNLSSLLKRFNRSLLNLNNSIKEFDFDLGFIVALSNPESSPFFDFFSLAESPDEDCVSTFYTGTFNANNTIYKVVLGVCHEMGNSAAAIVTSKIIKKYKPKLLLMSGICGGVYPDINIGDVAIAEITFDYYSGKRYGNGDEGNFKPSPRQCKIPAKVKRDLEFYINNHFDAAAFSLIDSRLKPSPRITVFGSGSTVIADENFLNLIRANNRKLTAIDMEIYGFYSACEMADVQGIHFLAVKSVCDFANSDKDDDYQKSCSRISAQFLVDYSKYILGKAGR